MLPSIYRQVSLRQRYIAHRGECRALPASRSYNRHRSRRQGPRHLSNRIRVRRNRDRCRRILIRRAHFSRWQPRSGHISSRSPQYERARHRWICNLWGQIWRLHSWGRPRRWDVRCCHLCRHNQRWRFLEDRALQVVGESQVTAAALPHNESDENSKIKMKSRPFAYSNTPQARWSVRTIPSRLHIALLAAPARPAARTHFEVVQPAQPAEAAKAPTAEHPVRPYKKGKALLCSVSTKLNFPCPVCMQLPREQ